MGCIFDETLSGDSMAHHVINKVNSRLKFLGIPLRRLLCNAMIQTFFDYACNVWYPNLNKKLKTRLQAAQNKCIRFCLKLGDRSSLKSKEFENINWLPMHDSVCSVYKFFAKSCPDYFDELYFIVENNGINTRFSFQKLTLPRRNTNIGQKALSYIGPFLWNNLQNTLKSATSINAFKHSIKNHYFNELKKKES